MLGKFPDFSLLFHEKAISLSSVECVGTLANSGGRDSIYISDFRGTVAPSPSIYRITVRSRWPTRISQGYANGSFVSYTNIFIILFFNTFYHKQINRILIAAFIETFRQSLDPAYAPGYTPTRNVSLGELRTFNPKLRTSPEAKSMIGYIVKTNIVSLRYRYTGLIFYFSIVARWCKTQRRNTNVYYTF